MVNVFITYWLFVFISAYLSIQHRIFRILLTLDYYRYPTRKPNIMISYLLVAKHFIIQLAKMAKLCFEIKYYILTFKKSPITFEQGCRSHMIHSSNTTDSRPINKLVTLVEDTVADEFCIPGYRHLLATDPTSSYGLLCTLIAKA